MHIKYDPVALLLAAKVSNIVYSLCTVVLIGLSLESPRTNILRSELELIEQRSALTRFSSESTLDSLAELGHLVHEGASAVKRQCCKISQLQGAHTRS